MYLSSLLIDVGENPDRPRPGRLWLRNLYRVHQRLCMAFPSSERRERDGQFLQPYNPDDFPLHDVHVPRSEHAGFLFRVDPRPGANPVIIVQSALLPDWDYAFHNARYLLAAPPPDPKTFDPKFSAGQSLRFRLQANPVRRVSKGSTDAQGQPVDPKWVGKRVPVPAEKRQEWLAHRGERGGFKVTSLSKAVSGYVYVRLDENAQPDRAQRLISVLYEGVLEVTEPDLFLKTLKAGIGSAKAFGFGLLSLAPVQRSDP